LIYMAIRLIEMKRLLKPSGSIYLHCDPTSSHYLKLLMDSIFNKDRFINEIVWSYGLGGSSKNNFSKKHDVLFFYSKTKNYIFYKPFIYATSNRMAGKMKGMLDVWSDIPSLNNNAKERTGYPTQKPLTLLRRIIKSSSGKNSIVLDPFCGCATACIAAELEHRQWIGIDISEKAADLVRDRMNRDVGLFFSGVHRTDIPTRTDLGVLLKYNDKKNKTMLYGEQGGYCNGCEGHFELRNFHVDHIIPRSKGGTDHISNLQLLCGACNSLKGDRPHEYLLACLTDKGWIKRKLTH